jgi:acyl carrier protein
MEDTFEAVKTMIADVLKIDAGEITMDTRLIEDLKADSMDQFFMVDGLCEKFGIEISNEDARDIHTVGDAVRVVDQLTKK